MFVFFLFRVSVFSVPVILHVSKILVNPSAHPIIYLSNNMLGYLARLALLFQIAFASTISLIM
jgi:hypothetical protein